MIQGLCSARTVDRLGGGLPPLSFDDGKVSPYSFVCLFQFYCLFNAYFIQEEKRPASLQALFYMVGRQGLEPRTKGL